MPYVIKDNRLLKHYENGRPCLVIPYDVKVITAGSMLNLKRVSTILIPKTVEKVEAQSISSKGHQLTIILEGEYTKIESGAIWDEKHVRYFYYPEDSISGHTIEVEYGMLSYAMAGYDFDPKDFAAQVYDEYDEIYQEEVYWKYSCFQIDSDIMDKKNYLFLGTSQEPTHIVLDGVLKNINEYRGGNTITLRNLNIPDNVYKIDKKSLWRLDFQSIRLPETLQSIGEETFGYKSLREIKVPDSVLEIGHSAFSKCKNLKTIHFLSLHMEVDEYEQFRGIFYGCDSLEAVYVNASADYIESLKKHLELDNISAEIVYIN